MGFWKESGTGDGLDQIPLPFLCHVFVVDGEVPATGITDYSQFVHC